MNKKKNKKKKRVLIILIAIAILVTILVVNKTTNKNEPIEISYTEFLENIDDFKTVTLQENSTTVTAIKPDSERKYVTTVINQEKFLDYIQTQIQLGEKIPEVNVETENTSTTEFLSSLWSIIFYLYLGFMIFSGIKFFRKMKNNVSNSNTPSFMNAFSTDTNYIQKIVKSNIKFSDVAGLDEEKEELIEIVDFLKNPEKYAKIGAKIPRGVLLSGEPGTGKTLLAKAVAGEASVAFLATSGSEFVEKYVGVGASRIRELFKEARKNAPCIIFIDEIDAVGSKREEGDNSERYQTLDQLLTELDGFEDRSNIILLAATNRPSNLDPALTRPGRFDRKIEVHLPDLKGREEILKLHAKNKLVSDDVDFKHIAYHSAGFSGAELENLLNEAALIAARHKEFSPISQKDIEEALRRITIGVKKAGRVISEKEKRLTAIHEAGHAIVSQFLNTQSGVKEISIIPRGSAGGYTMENTVEDKMYLSQKELIDRLAVLMAGRVAEKLILNDVSSGASNDLKVATKIAKEMVTIYGMDNDIGPMSLSGLHQSEIELLGDKSLSDIGNKIAELLKNAESSAEEMLKKHQDLILAITEELLEKETLSGEDFNTIFRKYSK